MSYTKLFSSILDSTLWIDAAFEVVWKSDLTERKVEVIHRSMLTVYTVSAHWIISQVARPDVIKVDRRVERFI